MKISVFIIFSMSLLACANRVSSSNVNKQNVSKSGVDNQDIKNIADSITFAVDSVEMATTFLSVYPTKEIIQWKLKKEIDYFPTRHASDSITPANNNGFMETIHICYDQHRPLVLSPDVIWLTICQGVSIHVNEHFDELKSVIFKDDKPDKLTARNDSLITGKSEEWASLRINKYKISSISDWSHVRKSLPTCNPIITSMKIEK